MNIDKGNFVQHLTDKNNEFEGKNTMCQCIIIIHKLQHNQL